MTIYSVNPEKKGFDGQTETDERSDPKRNPKISIAFKLKINELCSYRQTLYM